MLERRIEEEIAAEATAHVMDAMVARVAHGAQLDEVIGATLYSERRRLAHANGSPGDAADRTFYAHVAEEMRRGGAAAEPVVVRALVEHYAREIEGHFDPRVYAFATRALPVLLSGLLHGIAPRRLAARFGHFSNIDDHVFVGGEVDRLRALARQGTIVMVPTHSSNLDSLIAGHAIYRIGLPPFAYGAGLNLFSNPIEGFFMRHLGAYTVDRQKSDPLYRAVLKEYATASLERGQHNLFFPGGTRSRSGAIESHLKKGLLGTALTAFRRSLERGERRARFYVVPCTLSYPFVLEAATLIADYLEESRKSHSILVNDEYGRAGRWLAFLSSIMSLDVHVHVTIGAPLDPLGNDVDDEGMSRDPRGHLIDPARYLIEDGAIADDAARDAEYTNILAARIVAAYRRDNVVLPTAALAYAVFELLRARARHSDLQRFLREIGGAVVPIADAHRALERLLGELDALAARGAIRLCRDMRERDLTAIMDDALRTLATYHVRPVLDHARGELRVGDAELLFYCRNRLDGYDLLGVPPLVAPRSEP
jgi:glycerol-3-phosphate O-acyltransferase